MDKHKRSYTRIEEKSLSELIKSRKNFYQTKIAKTFDLVYNSGEFEHIEQFEHVISLLSTYTKQGNLERILTQIPVGKKAKTEDTLKVDKRPRLTSYQYSKARDDGMTHEQIKEKFRMKTPHQIGGFAKQYERRKKEIKLEKTPDL